MLLEITDSCELPSQGAPISQQRIFHHGLDAILPENHNSLDRTTRVTDSIKKVPGNRTNVVRDGKEKPTVGASRVL